VLGYWSEGGILYSTVETQRELIRPCQMHETCTVAIDDPVQQSVSLSRGFAVQRSPYFPNFSISVKTVKLSV